jgi:DNA-binding MarR family transcriptional regulator
LYNIKYLIHSTVCHYGLLLCVGASSVLSMAKRQSSEQYALAAAVWRKLFDFFISTRGQRDSALESSGLTPNDAKALCSLDTSVGKPMRALAQTWGTDASNATWVVDRLERLGLAERRAVPHDRRVKLVGLTARGLKTREEVTRAFREPPAELLALSSKELTTMAKILGKLVPTPLAPNAMVLDASRSTKRRPRPRRTPPKALKTEAGSR